MQTKIINVVVGPAYPDCLYSATPRWQVDYIVINTYDDGNPEERLPVRREFITETEARAFAATLS